MSLSLSPPSCCRPPPLFLASSKVVVRGVGAVVVGGVPRRREHFRPHNEARRQTRALNEILRGTGVGRVGERGFSKYLAGGTAQLLGPGQATKAAAVAVATSGRGLRGGSCSSRRRRAPLPLRVRRVWGRRVGGTLSGGGQWERAEGAGHTRVTTHGHGGKGQCCV
jgi:hypothetical protein